MKFSVGDLAVQKSVLRAYTSYTIDKVVAILDGALLLEHYGFAFDGEIHPENFEYKPGSRNWREAFERFQEQELVTPEEAIEEIHRLNEVHDKLNQDFEAMANQIKDKLDQAATLVKEAGDFAKACNKSLFDAKKEGRELFTALEQAGWSHSSMSC